MNENVSKAHGLEGQQDDAVVRGERLVKEESWWVSLESRHRSNSLLWHERFRDSMIVGCNC